MKKKNFYKANKHPNLLSNIEFIASRILFIVLVAAIAIGLAFLVCFIITKLAPNPSMPEASIEAGGSLNV